MCDGAVWCCVVLCVVLWCCVTLTLSRLSDYHLSLSLSLSLFSPQAAGNYFAAASLAEARLSQAKRCVPPALVCWFGAT